MTENPEDNEAPTIGPLAGDTADPDAIPQEPPVVVEAQYTKDLSFEAPGAPDILMEMQKTQPEIAINIDVSANPKQEPTFEVQLRVKAECKIGEKVGFILELVYAGLFKVNVPAEHLQAVLLIECPRLLFPFARNILADTSRDGGFPPLMLGPVDFVSMFKSQLRQFEQGGGDPDTSPPKVN